MRKLRTKRIEVAVTDEEKKRFEEIANFKGISVSAFVRTLIY